LAASGPSPLEAGSRARGDRERLAGEYAAVRSQSVALAAPLSAEDQQVQSMEDASPTKWHLAHASWFFETFVLSPASASYATFDPRYGYLFNSYYEAVGPRHPRPERGVLSRPSLEEIHAYRAHVDAAMEGLILTTDVGASPEIAAAIELGLHHEQQHQELMLMDIKHVFSVNPLLPAYAPGGPRASSVAPAATWTPYDGRLVEVGAEDDSFSFDNERPRHRVWLEPFRISDRLVTAGEWMEFIDDGGYRRAELWLSDGWTSCNACRWDSPLYWTGRDDGWRIFTLHGERRLTADEPVCHVSFYEADAFARWQGHRLTTEQEWEFAATRAGAFDCETPLSLHPHSATVAPEPRQFSGAVWQWTTSSYAPYPGYRPAAGALGEYNGKFMVNQMALRGSACITPPGHSRPTYRNFYPPSARWCFGGLRLAASC
jgi:ergothioneine biosynthesis protein EgtB